ncbi:CsiV family protein [Coxiella endosymbiont of Ornithodoros maritimus]|uniref:CsiV family protein n=1 Tax=Coxiella endosymbiont of Ornithodoros maritimus TaxID=1656172 RepID=UPI002263AEBF|nr:CsiV family protein [Coxiella endosymbiont of Ornithodoros maritimus]
MKKLLLLLTLFFACLQAQAKDYQIEMIIFSHFTAQNKSEEQWSDLDPGRINFNRARPIYSLPPSQFILKNEQHRLDQNPAYHILLHIAWRQSVVDAPLVRARFIQENNVEGTIRVSVKRYLNVGLNLVFKNNSNYFYLSQNRRMRSSELNYVDSPFYGVLIKIVPMKG